MTNPFQKIWDRLPAILKNKYFITSLAFLTYLMFFDSNDIPSQIRLNRHLAKLNKQTKYCEKMIVEAKKEYAATFSSVEQMETYAREHYLMKKPEEDLYIIEIVK
jgi:cell division protein DivIC